MKTEAENNRRYAKECESYANRKIDRLIKLDKIHLKYAQFYNERVEQYEQLAKWLEELKTLRAGEYMNLERPQEPKFYPNENAITLPYYGNSIKAKYPSGISESRYFANESGIQEEYDYLDENGEVMFTNGRMILPKEAFIAAYNAYIKDSE